MGEVADMILEGILCEICGVLVSEGDAPGHPVKCDACQQDELEGEHDFD